MNDDDERKQILDCYLLYRKWNKVSSVLGIPLRTLYEKKEKYNIDDEIKMTDDELHDLASKAMEESPLQG